MGFLLKLVDSDKIGGWTRAAVASVLAVMIGRWPALSGIFSPEMQAAVGVVVSGIAVGLWSTVAKHLSA